MKKQILTFLLIGVVALGVCGCSNTQQTATEKKPEQQEVIKTNPVVTADLKFANSLEGILNSGYSIVDKTKVYYTKSADFQEVYFLGTLVKKGTQYYNAVWATNNIESFGMGLVFSMNDNAIQSSGMGDGRTNREPLSETDDGYSRINQKVLDDMSEAVK